MVFLTLNQKENTQKMRGGVSPKRDTPTLCLFEGTPLCSKGNQKGNQPIFGFSLDTSFTPRPPSQGAQQPFGARSILRAGPFQSLWNQHGTVRRLGGVLVCTMLLFEGTLWSRTSRGSWLIGGSVDVKAFKVVSMNHCLFTV